jgi:RyR domain
MMKFFIPIDEIAKVAHDANRSYCQAHRDFSQRPWETAPEWQRDSAIQGVEFHLANRDAGPEVSHEKWMAVKLADGWTFGPVKDPEKKQHPCLRPYNELPSEQRMKDFLFRAIVHAYIDCYEGIHESPVTDHESRL